MGSKKIYADLIVPTDEKPILSRSRGGERDNMGKRSFEIVDVSGIPTGGLLD